MVVKLETVAALCADAYPTLGKCRNRDLECSEHIRRQKKPIALPALVEDESEESFVEEKRNFIIRTELRRQSISPQRRERMRRQLAMPSLSEDDEP